MKRWFVALALVLPGLAWGQPTYYAPVTIAAAEVDEVIPVIPIFLSEMDAAWWTAFIDGTDISVTSDDGTPLPWYRVSATDAGTTGTGCLLVNVSSVISASVDVEIRVFVGDAGATDGSDSAAVFSGTNYVAVYSLTGAEALVNLVNPGTFDLTNISSTVGAQAGQVEGMESFVGAGGDCLENTSFDFDTFPGTIEQWAYPTTEAAFMRSGGIGGATSTAHFAFEWGGNVGGDPIWATAKAATGSNQIVTSTLDFAANTWYYNVNTRSGISTGTTTLYTNGAANGTPNGGAITALGATDIDQIRMGSAAAGAQANNFTGRYGEFRVSNVARSANYMATNYSAYTNAGFLTVGSSVAVGGDGETDWVEFTVATSVTADGTPVWSNITNMLTSLSGAGTADIVDGDKSRQAWLTDANGALDEVLGSAITGVAIEVVATGEDGLEPSQLIYDANSSVRLIVGGSLVGAGFFDDGDPWTDAAPVTREYGGAGALDGVSLADTDVTASDFGVMLQFISEGQTTALVSVFRVRVKVFYGEGAAAANPGGFFLLF